MKFFSVAIALAASAWALLVPCTALAQASNWSGATTATPATGTTSYTTATAADASGNVYLAGYFTGAARFGSTTLTNAGGTDGFVAKWTNGAFVWAVALGGAAADQALAIAVNGNKIYVAGSYYGPAAFGSLSLSSAGGTDAFVAKLTDAGTSASFSWAERVGGAGDDQFAALALNGSTIVVAGKMGAPSVTFGNNVLISAGADDILVASYADQTMGVRPDWAQRAGGTGSDAATAVALYNGNVYVAGRFSGTASFGSPSLSSSGGADAFVGRLNTTSITAGFYWAVKAGGSGPDAATGLLTDFGGIYAVGYFGGSTAAFGATTLSTAGTNGNDDAFVAKLSDAGSSGAFAWALGAGGNFYDHAHAITRGTSGLYVTGYHNGPATFGSTSLSGFDEVFLARVQDQGTSGRFDLAIRGGGGGTDYGNALTATATNVYVGGYLGGGSSAATFGSTTLANTTNTNVAFLASFFDPVLATAAGQRPEPLALYPNPAQGSTTVQLPASLGGIRATLSLFDALGRVVRSELVAVPANGLPYALGLTGLPAGLYAVRVTAGGYAATQKLVVE